MTIVDITKTEVNEVIMRDNPKEICIDGKLLDLSKVQSVKIEFDYNGIEILLRGFDIELPFKENQILNLLKICITIMERIAK